jgi:hypothetical protein
LLGERIEDRITTADTMVLLPAREAFAVDRQAARGALASVARPIAAAPVSVKKSAI